jgi:hypothetical protein
LPIEEIFSWNVKVLLIIVQDKNRQKPGLLQPVAIFERNRENS